MQKYVSVNPPKNLSIEDREIFEPYLSYRLDPVKVMYEKDAFVTHSGFCFCGNGLLKECHHDYPDQYPDFVREFAQYYIAAYDNPENLVSLKNDETYLLIHHPWSMNFYHWVCESIGRLWLVRDRLADMVLLLPENYKKLNFVMESLEPFEFRRIFFIPDKKSLFVKNLCVPQIKPLCDAYSRDLMFEIRDFYLSYMASKKIIAPDVGDRIFLTRRKAAYRRIENEEEVERIVKRYGFRAVCNEDHSFYTQIAIYSGARYLFSIHGAGMTNLLFMKPDSAIFELHKKRTNDEDWHSFAYWYLADCLGFDYFQQLCDPVDPTAYFRVANFRVNTDLLEANFRKMVGNKPK